MLRHFLDVLLQGELFLIVIFSTLFFKIKERPKAQLLNLD